MDKIDIEILDDGTIKMTTDRISAPNHMNAESFMREVAKASDGNMQRKHKHVHTHTHEHEEHSH